MAQTLKFGNKVWAAKEESVLAYNDINNNYKPLPFDFLKSKYRNKSKQRWSNRNNGARYSKNRLYR